MRTLKKTLALVLVVAMMMSLCITSNAAFTDAKEIEYVEAVEVLTAIGVIDGFPSGEFQPDGSLTRAQAAKILVYILGAEGFAKADGQIFDDVKEGHWAADYIAYCAENGLVDGYGDGNFGPEDKLTGYQWAKMLLAALGEDTSAMIGAAWQIAVAREASNYGLFAGNLKADKTAVATREEACLYALNALKYGDIAAGYAVYEKNDTATKADDYIVEVYPSVTDAAHAAAALNAAESVTGKYYITGVIDGYYLNGLLLTVHGVACNEDYNNVWGRPGVQYTDARTGGYLLNLTYLETPIISYTTAVAECDIADDLGINYNLPFYTYTNGLVNAGTEVIEPLGTAKIIGAQGQLVEIYEDEIVIIDTLLAEVTDVKAATFDRNGHLKTASKLTLAVYNTKNGAAETVYVENGAVDYTYAKGDMLLVNAVANAANTVNVKNVGTTMEAWYLEIVGYAPVTTAALTAYNSYYGVSTIGGEAYDWACQYNLLNPGVIGNTYDVYTDNYGNLIGLEVPKTVTNFTILISGVKVTNGFNPYYAAKILNLETMEVEEIKVGAYTNQDGINLLNWKDDAVSGLGEIVTIAEGQYGYVLKNAADAWITDDTAAFNGTPRIYSGSTVKAVTDSETVYIVKTGSNYAKYVGYTNIPAISGADAMWTLGTDGYAELVYIDATNALYAGATTYAYIMPSTSDIGDGYNAGVVYNVWGGVVINGELTNVNVVGGYNLASMAGKFVTLKYDANGYVVGAAEATLTKDTVSHNNSGAVVYFNGSLNGYVVDETTNVWVIDTTDGIVEKGDASDLAAKTTVRYNVAKDGQTLTYVIIFADLEA